jgi:hypothetical protein
MFDSKIAVVVRDDLAPWQALQLATEHVDVPRI